MRATMITRIETSVDRAASALFAGACGYAAFTSLGLRAGLPLLGVEAAVAVLAAYFLCFRILGSIKPADRKAPLLVFDLRSFDPMEEPDELLLTEKCRLSDNPFERAEQLLLEHYKAAPASEEAEEEREEPLLLDDILAELGPDSRVVRLFDRDAMPTPGQLKSRIDRHLEPGESADAERALHDALAELRRSIR